MESIINLEDIFVYNVITIKLERRSGETINQITIMTTFMINFKKI